MERYLIAGLLIALTTGRVEGGCGPCRCRQVHHEYIVDCSLLGLVHPPDSLPANLTELSLRGNRIFHIDTAYFEQFPFLTTLDISSNMKLGFDNASVSFMGLRNSKIAVLDMSAIVEEFSDVPVVLTRKHFYFLKDTQLKEIYLDWNWIHIIEPFGLTYFPTSLEVISLRRSRLVLSPGLIISILVMKNLRKIDLTERNVENSILERQIRSGHHGDDNYVAMATRSGHPKGDNYVDMATSSGHPKGDNYVSMATRSEQPKGDNYVAMATGSGHHGDDNYAAMDKSSGQPKGDNYVAMDKSSGHPEGDSYVAMATRSEQLKGDNYVAMATIHLPPQLEELVFDRSGIWMMLPRIKFAPNRLKRLVLRMNVVDPLTGPVIGLDELEEIDLTDSRCEIVPDDMSNVLRFPKLKRLYMGQNSLDISTKEHIFDCWNELSVLDISFNKISIIPTGVFRSLTNLTKLNLRANIIYEFRVDIAHMTQLKTLDISDNKIVFLSAYMTKQLETINNVSNLTLLLSGNPIQCSCDKPKLTFIQWLVRTRVNIAKRSQLKCSTDYSDEGEQIVVDFIDQLEARCRSTKTYYTLTLCCAVFVTFGFCFEIFGLLYRYRYKLIYFYFIQRRKYNTDACEGEGNNLLEFDAYVAYADRDRHFGIHVLREYLEKQGNLRLCFRDRDILPGEVIASGILTAITSSRRVILVLTPDFLKNGWRRYELEMAQYEEIQRGDNIIVIIKLEKLPLHAVTPELIHMMHTNPCLEFPRLEEDQLAFWNTLREILNF